MADLDVIINEYNRIADRVLMLFRVNLSAVMFTTEYHGRLIGKESQ